MHEYFLDDWQYLMSEYKYDLPTGNELTKNGFKSLDELNQVVINAFDGKKENGLLRLNNVRNYLQDILKYEEGNSGAYIDDDYDIYEEKLELLKQLIEDLEPSNFKELAELITPEQEILVGKLTDKQGLGSDVKGEIMEFMGTTVKGGRKQRKTKRRKNKSASKRKIKQGKSKKRGSRRNKKTLKK